MAPPKKVRPEDFWRVHAMCDGNFNAIARHYSASGTPVDARKISQWAKEGDQAVSQEVEGKTLRQIVKDAGDNPDEVEITKAHAMRYFTPHGDHLYVKAEWKPSITALAARPEGWKRPKIKPRKKAGNELVCICGDQHAPEHDREFHAKFLSWLRENQPHKIVILGDLLENADVSRWADREGQATAKESIDQAYFLLRDYIDAAPDAQIIWICGNHDHRVETYASTNAQKVSKNSSTRPTGSALSL